MRRWRWGECKVAGILALGNPRPRTHFSFRLPRFASSTSQPQNPSSSSCSSPRAGAGAGGEVRAGLHGGTDDAPRRRGALSGHAQRRAAPWAGWRPREARLAARPDRSHGRASSHLAPSSSSSCRRRSDRGRARGRGGVARGRRGDGARRDEVEVARGRRGEAVKPAGGSNAVAAAVGGLVGSGCRAEGVADLAVARGEERGSRGGELVRKRWLESPAHPPPKRRAVSARRQFPPGCGRDAAALIAGGCEDRLRLGASTSHGCALEDAPVAPDERSGGSEEHGSLFQAAPPNAGSGAIDQKVASADGGTVAEPSDVLSGNAAAVMVPGLVVEERGRGVGSGELGRTKELMRILLLPPKRRDVSAKRSYPPGCGRNVAPLAGQRGGEAGGLQAVPANGCSGVAEEVEQFDSVVDQCAMGVVGALSKEFLNGTVEAEELEEGELAPEPHRDVLVPTEIAALDDSPRRRHEALMRYASDELKCMEGLQHEGKDATQAAQNDLLVGSKCKMSLFASADKSSEGRSNWDEGGWGSNGMNREPLGFAVADSASSIVKSKVHNMEKPSEADGCLGATSITQVYRQGFSNGIADGEELEEGEFVVEADNVARVSHVTADVILYESTDKRHEDAALAITTAETSVGRFSDEKICGNTLQCDRKSTAWTVSEDVKMMNMLPRSKIGKTARKLVRLPLKEHKSPMDTLPRSPSKGNNEKSVGTVREPLSPRQKLTEKSVATFTESLVPWKKLNEKPVATDKESLAPRMKLKVKGPALSKHLDVNIASTLTLVSNGKTKVKEASNLENDDILKALAIHEEKLELFLKSPACVPSVARHRQHVGQRSDARSEVKAMCMRFQFLCRFLVHAVEQSSLNVRRIDLAADKFIRKLPGFMKHEPIVGNVPGVEVGDEFLYRVQLALVGLHLPYQGGIGTTKVGGVPVAISIVASGGYPDELSSTGELIYTGSGGRPAGKKADEDQKLQRGNLALKNCIKRKTPVRVIHGFKGQNREESRHLRAKQISTFTYDGLYCVANCWSEGCPGSRVFKYRLQRIPGQPELPLRIAKMLRKSLVRPGLCIADISHGKERIPICVINDVDNARPTPFKYITQIKYPPLLTKRRPQGCDCTTDCSDSASCSCTVKNGGEIPFNFDGAVVCVKPLIFECGPSCSCPLSCPNRASQHGMKIPLEIFRTSKTGWGVRSLRSISSGSFICEYVGELLHAKEAEKRMNDEYLFEVGRNYNDEDLWKGVPSVPGLNASDPCSPIMEDVGFTIDAAEYGNIGRFINHSCSPNLYAQNVLWDHDDQKMPRIMFFAVENIPPLQELTYDYNYKIDHVYDVDGRKKVKYCHCGSPHCCGRLY